VTFDDAVKAHGADLFRFAYWLSRDRHRAEDIVQEALLRSWKAFGGLQDRGAVKSWMFSIVRNEY
jgi:RNA polymerase sigma-70 factor (ECF subfamily)